jgi:hypothetical protein
MSERVDRIRKISDEAIAHDQALVAALREGAEVAETDKEIAVEDNIRLMNESESLRDDLVAARQARASSTGVSLVVQTRYVSGGSRTTFLLDRAFRRFAFKTAFFRRLLSMRTKTPGSTCTVAPLSRYFNSASGSQA